MGFVWVVAVLVVLTACGRLGFDATTGTGDGAMTSDDGATDGADPCVGGDGLCAVACLATDPDCVTTCGDGRCVGNAGELCVSCADCATLDAVCGNGACDPSEDSGSCYPDCGPKPWTWDPNEEDFLARLNVARTGTTCPGGGGMMSAPPVVRDSGLDAGAREWAWESTYHRPLQSSACNGRSFFGRIEGAGGVAPYAGWVDVGAADVPTLVTSWLNAMDVCLSMMNSTYTKVGIGVAMINGERAYVLLLD